MSRPPSPPPTLQGFTYLQPLGTGGFADVFLYEQEMPRRKVAVKVLLADRIASGAAQEFTDEANVMAMLSTHPAIVTIYQAGVAGDGRPYLVMEYCPRPNLQVRARKEPFNIAEALRVGVQVAGAVETAHRAGVLHRDIKPANILVTEYNRPALTDFGIASTTGATTEAAGMSIPWSPPESFADSPRSDQRSDVWALGATLYTLMTGRSPFERPGERNSGADLIERIERAPLSPMGRADAPESLQRLLERAMAKNPDDRFPSAVAFARALQKVQIELSHSVTPVDIVDDHSPSEELEDDDDGLTRVRAITSIEPGVPSNTATRPSATTSAIVPQLRVQPGPQFETSPFAPGAQALAPDIDEATVIRAPRETAPLPDDIDATMMRAPNIASTTIPEPVQGVPVYQAATDALVEAPATAPRKKTALWVGLSIVIVAVLAVASVIAVNLLNADGTRPEPTETEIVDPQDVVSAAVPRVTDVTGVVNGDQVTFTWTNPAPEEGDSYLWYSVSLDGQGKPEMTNEATVVVPAAAGQTCIEVVLRRENGRGAEPVRGCTP